MLFVELIVQKNSKCPFEFLTMRFGFSENQTQDRSCQRSRELLSPARSFWEWRPLCSGELVFSCWAASGVFHRHTLPQKQNIWQPRTWEAPDQATDWSSCCCGLSSQCAHSHLLTASTQARWWTKRNLSPSLRNTTNPITRTPPWWQSTAVFPQLRLWVPSHGVRPSTCECGQTWAFSLLTELQFLWF